MERENFNVADSLLSERSIIQCLIDEIVKRNFRQEPIEICGMAVSSNIIADKLLEVLRQHLSEIEERLENL